LTCEAVLVHPESLALEELASLYLARRSPEQALKWYQKAAALRPDRPRTLELGGDINSQLGNVAEARTAFVQSLKVKPDDQKTLDAVAKQFVDEGNVQLRSGAFSKAELLFRKAITLSGENQDAAGGLAATYAGTGNVESARRWATRTLSLDEGHHVALIVMAALATETGDEEQAIALIDRALKRSPHYAPAHQLLHKLRPTKAAPVARALPATQEQPSSSPAAEQPAAAQPATPPATATPPTGNQPAAEQPTAP